MFMDNIFANSTPFPNSVHIWEGIQYQIESILHVFMAWVRAQAYQ